MEGNGDKRYKAPELEEFFRECVAYCVSLRIDMMPDSSWRRLSSDKTVRWMFDHFDKARETFFIQKKHVTGLENERWKGETSHIEAGFTIRINNTDYLLSIEIDNEYLNYFLEKYKL